MYLLVEHFLISLDTLELLITKYCLCNNQQCGVNQVILKLLVPRHAGWSLPDEIGDDKKLHTSVYESKSSVFNHHHLWCLVVPETKKILF